MCCYTNIYFVSFQIYDEKEMLKGKLDLLSNTAMVDFAMDVYSNLYPDSKIPPSLYSIVLFLCS